MRDASEHLSHGGEFFGLQQLLLDMFFFGDVARRGYDAGHAAVGIGHGAGGDADGAVAAIFVADAIFHARRTGDAREQIVELLAQVARVFRMRALAHCLPIKSAGSTPINSSQRGLTNV